MIIFLYFFFMKTTTIKVRGILFNIHINYTKFKNLKTLASLLRTNVYTCLIFAFNFFIYKTSITEGLWGLENKSGILT